MRTRPEYHEPDMIDLFNLVSAIGDDYHLTVQYQTTISLDYVTVIARAYYHGGTVDPVLHFQALVKKPLRVTRDVTPMLYTVTWDIWCQAEGLGATAASRPAPISWNGRPHITRRAR